MDDASNGFDPARTWVLPADELAARRTETRVSEAALAPADAERGLSAERLERLLRAAAARERSPRRRDPR